MTKAIESIILYHENCTDGVFAAHALKMGGYNDDSSIFLSVNYGNGKYPDTKEGVLDYLFRERKPGSEVEDGGWERAASIDRGSLKTIELIVVDFCFPPHQIKWLVDTFRLVVILDHHKTAEADLAINFKAIKKHPTLGTMYALCGEDPSIIHDELSYAWFNMERSGAALAWMWTSSKEVPLSHLHVEDRDLWKFNLVNTKDFCAGVRGRGKLSFAAITSVMKDSREVIALGKVLNANNAELIEQVLRTSSTAVTMKQGEYVYDGVLIDLSVKALISETCNKAIVNGNLDFAIAYSFNTHGGFGLSARSRDGFDISQLATSHGGGGHENSAGFHVDIDTLVAWLKTGEVTF